MDDFKVFLIEILWAVTKVLRNARVAPISSIISATVLLPARLTRAMGLPDIDGFFGAGAGVFIYPLFFLSGRVGLVFAAEDILKGGARGEGGGDPCLF